MLSLEIVRRYHTKILQILALATLISVPLYPKFPFLRIPGTYVSVRLEDFLIAFTSLVIALYYIPKIKTLLKNSLFRAILVFLGVGLSSVVSAILVTQTVLPHLGILHWVRRIEYLVPFFLGAILFTEDKKSSIELYIKTIILVIFLLFIYGFGQRYWQWPVIITQNYEYAKGIALRWVPGSHVNSTFAGHYDLATFLILVMPIMVSLFFLIKEKVSKLVLFLAFICGIWLLASAVSRISVVSYLISVTFSLFLLRKYKAIIIVVIASVLFFGFSTDLISRYTRVIEVLRKNIQMIIYSPRIVYAQAENLPLRRISSETPNPTPMPVFEDRSTSIRLNAEWPRAIRAFLKNPLLGTGYSSITLATDNEYLRLLGEVGILGFFAFFLPLIRILMNYIKELPLNIEKYNPFELSFLAGVIGSIPGLLLNAVFIDIFEASKFAIIFWLLTGMALSIIARKSNEQVF